MSTELTVHGQQPATALTIADEQGAFTPQQVDVLRHMGVEGASEGDLAVFFHVVKRTGLDPFAKQIYMIGRQSSVKDDRTNQWTKVWKHTIQTGIDGYRLIGRRAANASRETISVSAPEWAHEDGSWRPVWSSKWGWPLAARVTIHRGASPFTAVALFDEYKQTKRDGSLTQMWEQRPAGQIAKCAEALAWRQAFPQDLAGIYVDEEMQQADREEPAPAPAERSGRDRLRAAVPTAAPPQQPAEPEQVHDAEVVEDAVPVAEPMTTGQNRKIHALFRDLGLADDEDRQRAGMSRALGREVASRKDLSKTEAGFIIESLEVRLAQQRAEPAPADAAQWPEVAQIGGAA